MSGEYMPTTDDIEDAYAGTWMNWNNERGRQAFRAWLAAELAAAERRGAERGWDEGADYAWRISGEGWNGEYNSVTLNDPATFRGLHPRDPNPYRADREDST